MAEGEVRWMEDLRKNFCRFDQTRARAIEKGVSIHSEDLLVFHCV
jgi:hypothetical protein